MTLLELPNEIWTMIIGFIYETIRKKEILLSLMLVNKKFHDLTLPFYYDWIVIGSEKELDLLCKVLKEKPHYSKFIVNLTFWPEDDMKENDEKRKFLFSLMSFKMAKLKNLLLFSEIPQSFIVMKNFKISDHLVRFESYNINLLLFCENQVSFPCLSELKVYGSDFDFFPIELLHYLGFPYIDFEKFKKYFIVNGITDWNWDYIGSENSFDDEEEDIDEEQSFDYHKAFYFFLSTKDKNPKSHFPKLRYLVFLENAYSDKLEFSLYFLIIANIGLPSLTTLKVENPTTKYDEQILNQALSKRPFYFWFVGNYKRSW